MSNLSQASDYYSEDAWFEFRKGNKYHDCGLTWCFSVLEGKFRGGNSNYNLAASNHIISHSLFAIILCHCVICVFDNPLNIIIIIIIIIIIF
jgi:hypothetical protein